MGEAFDIAAVTGAWQRMLQVPDRPSAAAWSAEHEPSRRRLASEAWRLEVNADHRRGLLRGEAALLADRLLCAVARGRGALAPGHGGSPGGALARGPAAPARLRLRRRLRPGEARHGRQDRAGDGAALPR